MLFAIIACVSTSALSVSSIMLPDDTWPSSSPTATATTTATATAAIQRNKAYYATAIILNTNARSVTKEMEPLAQSIFGREHVFLTATPEEARRAAKATLPYKLVIPVGGDGTLSSLVNEMCQELVSSSSPPLTMGDAMKQLPLFGYIPMGTGNGVGSVVGCRLGRRKGLSIFFRSKKRHRLRQLKQVMELLHEVGQTLVRSENNNTKTEAPVVDNYSIVNMPMIQIQSHYKDELLASSAAATTASNNSSGALCFFAGVGFDSLMLNDFKTLKAWSQRTGILKRALGSVTGYCIALVTMTLPQCVLQNKHKIHVQLTTRCQQGTLWIDHRRGDFAEAVGSGTSGTSSCDINGGDTSGDKENTATQATLLYQGPAGILAAGTSPFYGGGLRLFPFARLYQDKMHLRLGRIHPIKGFLNIPKIFEGSYRDEDFGCLDFVGNDFDIEVRQDNEIQKKGGYPFQHSGESAGHFERFRLRLENEPVRFVSFLPRRVINADKTIIS